MKRCDPRSRITLHSGTNDASQVFLSADKIDTAFTAAMRTVWTPWAGRVQLLVGSEDSNIVNLPPR